MRFTWVPNSEIGMGLSVPATGMKNSHGFHVRIQECRVQCSVTQASRLTIGLHRFSILNNGQTLQFLTSVQGHHTLKERLVISGSIAKENMLHVSQETSPETYVLSYCTVCSITSGIFSRHSQ